MLLAANLDTYGLLTLRRPSVRCYSTLRAWSPVCGSTLRSVKQQGSDGCSRWQDYFFHFFRMLWYELFFFGDAELFSPSMIDYFSKYFFP